jgi:hypothetical protein
MPPSTIKKLGMARSGLANIWQYFNVSRPTMTAAMKWDDFTHISPRHIGTFCVVLHLDARTRTLLLASSRVESSRPSLNIFFPISLLCDYREAVRRYADRNRGSRPPLVWQLPTEGVLPSSMNSEKMNLWFKTAAKAAGLQLPDNLTAHGHRSGGGTAAKKLGVDVAIFCQLADLDFEGKTFFRKYWRNNLMRTLVLHRRFFARSTRVIL